MFIRDHLFFSRRTDRDFTFTPPAAASHIPWYRSTRQMVTATDFRRLTERWSRIALHLEGHDMKYGIELVQLLERIKGPGLAYFDDPLEAAIVFTTIEVLKGRKKERGTFDP